MTYNPSIPNATDLLSNSQGQIKDNFTKANSSFGTNHYAFSDATANNGKHKFVELPISAVIPVGLTAGEGTIYTKTANAASQIFYSPDNSGNEYQLTRTIAASFARFSTLTVFDGTIPNLSGGWTFLPGGLLLQYGFLNSPVNNNTIKYPVVFTTFAIPTLGAVRNTTDDKTISIKTASVTTSQFQIILSGSSLPTGLYWMAIGK